MDLIAFGTVFLEIVFGHVPALPGPGEEIFAEEFAISCGGGALTAASAASRAGATAGMAAVLGDDLGSRVAAEHCARVGVDLSPCLRASGRVTGITVVLNFSGDRAFVSHLPRSATARPESGHWPQVLRDYRPAWCYLHAHTGMSELAATARSLGIKVAVDVALNDIADDAGEIVRCARLADVLLPNEDELIRLTRAGSLTAGLRTALGWCPRVVVKRGPRATVVAEPAGCTEVSEGICATAVRDRTGAGDAFAGALIAALCRGASLAEAAADGNAMGCETVGKLGAVGEVEVAGLSAAGPALGATLLGAMAAERETRTTGAGGAAAGGDGR